MPYISDLHVHSHYSRATSKNLNLESLYQWAKIKGINVVGTGDFTHPEWFDELKQKLQPDGRGFYTLKNPPEDPAIPGTKTRDTDVRFCLTTEISSIYKHGDRVRKNHNLVYAPDLDTVARINHKLSAIGNLQADGRPILGLPSRDLLEIVRETSDRAYLVPAHIWTPWFSTLGSKAGYDSIEACFRDLTSELFAVETGLSSDPAMNWRLSNLDQYTLISNSDAHSPSKLGREANLLDTELSYDGLFGAFKTGNGFLGTYEFYPQEGKYHHDGHRKCDISFEPEITKKHNSMCPECGKPLTVGVLHRVVDLADRQQPQKPREAADYRYIIPLPEVLGEIEGVGPKTKTVRRKYRDVISNFGNEFDLLHQVPIEEVEKKNGAVLAEAVRRIRDNDVNPKAGYDGVFGVIKVFEDGEIERIRGQLGFFGIDEYKVDEKQQQAAEPEPNAYEQEEKKTSSGAPYSLNPQQQKVKDSLRGTTLVKAGPGTGKTHTLVEWIVNQVERGQRAPDQVMAVTFTNKSAEELQLRLTNRLGPRAKSMVIGTFHAIAWQLLKELRPNIHTIYDKGARRMTLRFLFPELSSSERKRLEEDLLRFFELGTELPADFKGYARRYQDYLDENGAVDLSNIINRLVSTIKDENGIRIKLQNRFKAIAVDELQDINPVQYEMVELLGGGDGKSMLAIGDPDQSIYGFRGSDLSLFFKFGSKFEANEIELSRNYRSTGNILEAAGSVIDYNQMKSGAGLRPSKEEGSLISVYRALNPLSEADYILDQVERYIGGIDSLASGIHTDSQHSYGLGDIAVLYRTNMVGESLFKAFLKAGIPVNFGDGSPFLTEPPFTVIANLLQLKVNPGNKMALSDLLSEGYGWSDAQITSLLNAVSGNGVSLFGDELFENISDPLQEDLENLKKIYADITEHIESSELTLAVRLACKEFMPEDLLTDEQLLKKETLLELAEESDQDLEHFLEQMQLNPYTDAGRLKSEGVHLLTFHAAKGLEFPVVLIAAAEEGIAPILREDTDMEEERRLFYVAMTRAEEGLQITYTTERSRYGELRKMEASRFISEIPEHLKEVSGYEEAKTEGEKEETQSEQLGLF